MDFTKFMSWDQKKEILIAKLQNQINTKILLEILEKVVGPEARKLYTDQLNLMDSRAEQLLIASGEKKPEPKK